MDSPTLEYSKVVSPNDTMWKTGPQWYFDIGLSALMCIQRVLSAGHVTPMSILDLPCGHGRVCRMLRAAYPAADLTVCDLDPDAVKFCAREFSARPVVSDTDVRKLAIDRQFDLIWCGSLFTHLERERWPHLLGFFAEHLTPGGVLVFTTHGRQPIQWMNDDFYNYGLTREEQLTLQQGYRDEGFGFVMPANQPFGLSLSSVAWVCTELQRFSSLKVIGVHEAGWTGHQDTFACQRLTLKWP
jgi:SAM-dependent methyltransferase